MDLLKMILEAQGGGLLKQVAEKCNVDESRAGSAVSALFPSLAGGMKGNISKPGGLEDLLSAIQSGNHARYVENPAEITSQTGIDDGNSILGHILGSKDRSRQVATQAAEKTGIDVNILKSMLPMIASAMMGGISGKAQSSGLGRQPGVPGRAGGALDQIGGSGGFGAILGKMLEAAQPEPPPAPEPPPKRGLFDIVGKFFK